MSPPSGNCSRGPFSFFVSCGKSAVSPFLFKSCFLLCSSANPGPQCDLANGWSPYGSNCYKLKADTMKSWSQARHDCVQEGGDLVSITSAAEEQYVTGILGTSQLDIWIGFSTLVRGTSLSYLMFKISISCIGVKLGFDFFFFFSRNATRFHVKSKQETRSLLGLMPRQQRTTTGPPMNRQCKTSHHIPVSSINLCVCNRGLKACFHPVTRRPARALL